MPCIKDADEIPALDLDAILVAIRRCTYGEKYDMESECNCERKATTQFTVDLNRIISSVKVIDDIKPIELASGIRVVVKPVTVKSIMNLNWVQFEQIRNMQMAEQKDLSQEDQLKLLNNSHDILLNSSIKAVCDCIEEVVLPEGVVVTDKGQIFEWASQMERPEFKKLESSLMAIAELGINKEVNVQCANCEKQFPVSIDLNPTTFFG